MADQTSNTSNGFFLSLSSPSNIAQKQANTSSSNNNISSSHLSYDSITASHGYVDHQITFLVEEPTSSNSSYHQHKYCNSKHNIKGNKHNHRKPSYNHHDDQDHGDDDEHIVKINDIDAEGNDCDDRNNIDDIGNILNDDDMEVDEMIKGEIVAHPLYEKLLSTHLECLTIGLPHECAKELEKQVSNGHVSFAIKYLAQKKAMNNQDQSQKHNLVHHDLKKDIDEFMRTYLQALTQWRLKMEESILPQMKKTMHELLEIEHSFCELIESSDDEEYATKLTLMGSTTPCTKQNSSFATLMDIKQHLGENYRENIFSIRDAILKKRQGSRLQADITILTNWWNENSNWPYPTEEEKRQMANETGLEMRQINNWFINNRKRKWHRDVPKKS